MGNLLTGETLTQEEMLKQLDRDPKELAARGVPPIRPLSEREQALVAAGEDWRPRNLRRAAARYQAGTKLRRKDRRVLREHGIL